jgi:predicted oxidoreductase
VSCIAYGTLHMGRDVGTPEGVLALLTAALANGITTLDTSDVYSQMPELLGRALALQPGLRESFEIIAKTDIVPALGGVFGFDSGSAYDGSCAHLNSSVARYLAALNSSYVDASCSTTRTTSSTSTRSRRAPPRCAPRAACATSARRTSGATCSLR